MPDRRAPVMPWDVYAQEEMNPESFVPHLTLIWDQINTINYLKAFGDDKKLCTSSSKTICYVRPEQSCGQNPSLCMDFDVATYLVFRFESFEEASIWGGSDSDGDLWPDEVEELEGSDRCDPGDMPLGPLPVTAWISQEDPEHLRILETGKKFMFFQDTQPLSNNQVYWYRIGAQDPGGNLSDLSPPLRAVLWDRSQPDVIDTDIQAYYCENTAVFYPTESVSYTHLTLPTKRIV